jgi:hypothetical protein
MSFFSKALYSDVCLQWKGTCFAYLLLLLVVCWIPSIVKIHRGICDFVDNEAPTVISQIPKITIVNGKASIEEPQPYHIIDPETDEVFFIIDTTGTTTSLEETDALVLMTETQATIKKSEFETRTFSFSEFGDFTLDQEMITGWLTIMKKLAAPVLYPLAVLGSYAFRIIQVLIYAAIGFLFAYWCKSERSYASLIRLAVVAVTPCIIVRTVLDAGEVDIPVAGLWFFLLAMGYLFYGVRSASQDEGPTDDQGQGLTTETTWPSIPR